MKKVIFGAAMLISGVIGLVGWFIACALTVQPGGKKQSMGLLKWYGMVPGYRICCISSVWFCNSNEEL